jgi:hypothetical protein
VLRVCSNEYSAKTTDMDIDLLPVGRIFYYNSDRRASFLFIAVGYGFFIYSYHEQQKNNKAARLSGVFILE